MSVTLNLIYPWFNCVIANVTNKTQSDVGVQLRWKHIRSYTKFFYFFSGVCSFFFSLKVLEMKLKAAPQCINKCDWGLKMHETEQWTGWKRGQLSSFLGFFLSLSRFPTDLWISRNAEPFSLHFHSWSSFGQTLTICLYT